MDDTGIDYVPCDNLSILAIRSLADKIFSQFGRVDVLVNNAGVAPKVRLDLLETTEESFDFVLDTNLKGPFFHVPGDGAADDPRASNAGGLSPTHH